ncbi:GNAT family N-acetyltransferase [Neobacillus ginsengisoli]|uniref:RimJ/RimL family protein N-acetyltransferase n=1 Tax=Neobacillus ginsengisoli TaxID=904295 RepID=A0ABT9XX99_9BACI|nr:GNAT family N-acetyltransferase [Neobacillus ginsengisoli]MDQ0200124.1 RimJ/RimL family protein N-acetyltransferase [Neobacillus ginsengisoli]
MLKDQDTRLAFYQPIYKHWLEHYFLPEEQSKFSAHPLDAIALCEVEDERYPILIFHHDVPAGFFVLHGWNGVQAYSDNKIALLLRAFSVDASFQGKGIAKESLRLLPSFVKEHFPGKNEIILTVNHRNAVAQHVYTKSGFVDKGLRTMGSKGQLFIMHLNL